MESESSFYFTTKAFLRKNNSEFLIISTALLLFLNVFILYYYFDDLTNDLLTRNVSITNRQYFFVVIESIVGKHLTVFDFIYLISQQAVAVFYSKFTLSSIAFLVYLQICKALMSVNVHEKLSVANMGIQTIISLQLFIIMVKLILGKTRPIQGRKTGEIFP